MSSYSQSSTITPERNSTTHSVNRAMDRDSLSSTSPTSSTRIGSHVSGDSWRKDEAEVKWGGRSFQPFDDDVDHPSTAFSGLNLQSDDSSTADDQRTTHFQLAGQGPSPVTPQSARTAQSGSTGDTKFSSARSGSRCGPSMPVTPSTPWYGSTALPPSPGLYEKAMWSDAPLTREDVGTATAEQIGRFLKVSGIPATVTDQEIQDWVRSIAKFKAIILKFRASRGYIIVTFWDPREAFKVFVRASKGAVSFRLGTTAAKMKCSGLDKHEVRQATDGHPGLERVWDKSEPVILVEITGDRPVSLERVKASLEEIGSVMRIEPLGRPAFRFVAQFYDTRDAAAAIARLNGAAAGVGRLKVTYHLDGTFPQSAETTDLQQKTSSYTLGSAAYRLGSLPTTRSSQIHEEPASDRDVFGPVAQTGLAYGRSISHGAYSRSAAYTPAPSPGSPRTPFQRYDSTPAAWRGSPTLREREREQSNYNAYSTPATPTHLAAMERRMSEPGMLQGLMSRVDISARSRQGQGFGAFGPRGNNSQAVPEENRVFPERILSGLDGRTSVMVKDVPNKLSRQELVKVLQEVVPGEFDFVYLRFDFQNCCNVGYAFVNFTSVKALYKFIQGKVGQKWNMFSSEKVLQISYANIQGKQNLINKFRNSAVMGVIEPWRPQIFYSSGSKKGLPEPFPTSDNPLVAKRSQEARLSQLSGSQAEDESEGSTGYNYDYSPSMYNPNYGF